MSSNINKKLIFEESEHVYTYDGEVIPSVTQVINPLYDLSNIPKDILEYKSTLGTAVHLATELFDNNDLDESSLSPALIPYVNAWIKFITDTDVEILSIENRVFHPLYKYAGTLDRGVILNNKRAIIDIKCVAQLGPHVGVQLAGYLEAKNKELTKAKHYTHRYAVQLKPDGTYRLEPYTNKSDFSVFVGCLNLMKWRKNHGFNS